MDIVELMKAALFGLVEGVTEWLPISSTGHLLLLDHLVTLHVSPRFWNMFLVVIQLGAILAVCRLYARRLNPLARGRQQDERRAIWSLWAKVIVACVPAALVGIPLDDVIERYLSGPLVIAVALVVYGIAFIIIETRREERAVEVAKRHRAGGGGRQPSGRHLMSQTHTSVELADLNARVKRINDVDFLTALLIGCFQVLALVPGTSRSGATIIGGLLLGCSRAVAAEFTFYLAIPVMLGASGLRLVKYLLATSLGAGDLMILLVGCLSAYLVSLFVIRFLMGYVKDHDFKVFGWYRIMAGIVIIMCAVALW